MKTLYPDPVTRAAVQTRYDFGNIPASELEFVAFFGTETHKLMHFYTVDEWEMYDIATDPEEKNNLYGQPAHAAKQKELMAALERLFNEIPTRSGLTLQTAPAQSF